MTLTLSKKVGPHLPQLVTKSMQLVAGKYTSLNKSKLDLFRRNRNINDIPDSYPYKSLFFVEFFRLVFYHVLEALSTKSCKT